jgi:hypothetical protein
MAAVLACGPDAVLSHRDAAYLWDLRRSASARIDVTAPRSRHGLRGIVLHRVRRLDPRDRTVQEGIPVTTVSRALLDNAEVLRTRQLERMIEEAERLGVFNLTEVQDVCERNPGRRGLSPLIACVGATCAEPPHTKSDLELMFLDLCREADLPMPTMNTYVEGYEVDAHWPGTDLVIELDSWGFHRTRGSFERDHARDLKLKRARYTVLRLTWRQLTRERAEVTTTLRVLLGSARTPPARGRGALAHASP